MRNTAETQKTLAQKLEEQMERRLDERLMKTRIENNLQLQHINSLEQQLKDALDLNAELDEKLSFF
jgi:hypothetical protein